MFEIPFLMEFFTAIADGFKLTCERTWFELDSIHFSPQTKPVMTTCPHESQQSC